MCVVEHTSILSPTTEHTSLRQTKLLCPYFDLRRMLTVQLMDKFVASSKLTSIQAKKLFLRTLSYDDE
jgi:hypothetical protein